ncbi:MAG: ACT domain-containing protein [Clostridia bacterium]|nr:ACT domain-containing protein [Clostridia bacterium]
MKAVITVVGKDTVGILAKVSALCAEHGANIIDVTQTVMQDMFCMIMLCETDALTIPFSDFVDKAEQMGDENHLKIHVMNEDLFNSMHRI